MNLYKVRIQYTDHGNHDESHYRIYAKSRDEAISIAIKEFNMERREYMKIKIGKINAVQSICD